MKPHMAKSSLTPVMVEQGASPHIVQPRSSKQDFGASRECREQRFVQRWRHDIGAALDETMVDHLSVLKGKSCGPLVKICGAWSIHDRGRKGSSRPSLSYNLEHSRLLAAIGRGSLTPFY